MKCMTENQNEKINNYLPPSSERTLTSYIKDNKENEYQRISLINLKNSENSLIENDKKEDHQNNLIEKELKLICQKCGKENKKFYKCFDCELILCQECKEQAGHDKLIEYELFNI